MPAPYSGVRSQHIARPSENFEKQSQFYWSVDSAWLNWIYVSNVSRNRNKMYRLLNSAAVGDMQSKLSATQIGISYCTELNWTTTESMGGNGETLTLRMSSGNDCIYGIYWILNWNWNSIPHYVCNMFSIHFAPADTSLTCTCTDKSMQLPPQFSIHGMLHFSHLFSK